ncbi:MAG: calcium-binding protein, partial [Pseudomonadota bacterium]
GGDAAPGFVAAGGVVEWETRGALLGGSAAVAGARGASSRGGTGGDGGDGGPPGPPGFIQDPADPGPDGDDGADASESLGWNDDQRAGVAGPTAVVDGSEDVDVPGGAPSLVFAHGTRTQVKEGKALIFSIARMGDASREEVVRWRLNEEIADDVRGSTSGRVRFEEGQTTASVRVRTLKDGLSEGNAGVQFTINGQRLSDEAALGTRQVSASVEDRDQGTEGRDRLQGSSGVDVIEGLGAADRLFGRGSGDFLIAGDGRDRAWGGAGDDFVLGEGGKDRVFGGGGDDELYGGADDDALNGGRGRDVLSDGTGADVMTGGAGRDVFRLSTRDGSRDEILDFASGKDQMHFFGDGEIAFLGAQAFDGSAQAIRTVERKRGVLVQVDDDGDGEADATVLVRLRGESLQEGDFGLF